MAEHDPNDPNGDGTFSREQLDAILANPKRKPIIPDQKITKYMDTLEFQNDLKRRPLSKLGFEGVDRGKARVNSIPLNSNTRGLYHGNKQSLSDEQLSQLMSHGKIKGQPGKKDITMDPVEVDVYKNMGASDGASYRDSIAVTNSGNPNDDLRRTDTLHHEFGHRAISILREQKGIDVFKMTGLGEEELMGTMSFMRSPDWGAAKARSDIMKGGKKGESAITKDWRQRVGDKFNRYKKNAENPKVLAGIVLLQQAAAELMLEFSKKMASQKPDDGLGYSPEQEADLQKKESK